MSLILKGIDLPRNGDCHHITIYDNGDTYMTTSNRLYETDRKDVEVVEIPTPHGRLIDADKLKMECYNTMEELVESTTMNISAEALSLLCGFTMIGEAPTILEAEG